MTNPPTTVPPSDSPEPTPPGLPLSPGRWTLDAAHSSVSFSIRHLGISKVRGTFNSFRIDTWIGGRLDQCRVEAVIDVASIDTGNADRDAHTLAPDLLDVSRRPELRFVSTEVVEHGAEWILHGTLSIGDVTRPVSLDLAVGGVEVFPVDGTTHAGLELRGSIDRHDFGLHFGVVDPGLGRRADVEFDVQLVAPGG